MCVSISTCISSVQYYYHIAIKSYPLYVRLWLLKLFILQMEAPDAVAILKGRLHCIYNNWSHETNITRN